MDAASVRGWRLNTPTDDRERGASVVIDIPDGAAVTKELMARDVIVDYRPGAGIRVAPHFYTSDDEVEGVVASIDEILAQEDWKRYSETQTVVT